MPSLYSLHCVSHCSVHPHHPACAQQNGDFPIGADPSGSFFASSWKKCLPIVRLWFLYKLHPSWVTRLVCAYTGEKNYGPRTPPLCSLSLDLVTGKLYTLESCVLDSTRGSPCGFTLEACYPLPAVLGFARLDSTQGLPCGFTLKA